MINLEELLKKTKDEWEYPKYDEVNGGEMGFKLQCTINSSVNVSLKKYPFVLPTDLKWTFENYYSIELFKDVDYGQWGLKLLNSYEAIYITEEQKMDRPLDFKDSDLIIGTFYGDSDLLLLTYDESDSYTIVIALPIDERQDWPIIANNFSEFLVRFCEENGNKYWAQ